jgi:hypothetical protein
MRQRIVSSRRQPVRNASDFKRRRKVMIAEFARRKSTGLGFGIACGLGVCFGASAQPAPDSCGGHIFTEHPGLGLTDVYAAVVPDLPFISGLHVNHGETRLSIQDGLMKLKDFPKGFGGAGIELPE